MEPVARDVCVCVLCVCVCADPNCLTGIDDAALHIAAPRNFSVAITWLLDKRADPAARHGSGQTAYDLATDDVAKRLLH